MSGEGVSSLVQRFGSRCFRETVIREYLSRSAYNSYTQTIELGKPIDVSIAAEVAKALMTWAIAHGATHYAHWFIPLTNAIASKHDAFLTPTAIGEATLEFSTSTLIKGEPDASSFPSGGLRATFEARGYTTWDPRSPPFVRDGTLYIPSVFLCYTGLALDHKIPLLRSLEALNAAGLRFLKLFPKVSAKRVWSSSGVEQEYFLVPRDLYKARPDLELCGRTLLGVPPSKTQQLEDHYMGHILIQIADFMSKLDHELWELGVPAKTKHNEVAPAQHELAPVYEASNIAADHNHMMMQVMRTTAKQCGLACLLHEKPFHGVNGSGKHNNFSVATDAGLNLFGPATDDDFLFLLSVCGLIRAADVYADLLRLSAASPSNDQRLGGYEAPPPILSVFLGENLLGRLLEVDRPEQSPEPFPIVPSLPDLQIDDSDRNRTSPFAFTGNKFEFRMLGSSQNVAVSNTFLNTAMADSFAVFAERLEAAQDKDAEKRKIIAETMAQHGRVVFNGDNYSKAWVAEAKKRKLPIISNTVDAADALLEEKNLVLFEKFSVLTREEAVARYEVILEGYVKTISIEADTVVQMVKRSIIPAVTVELGKRAQALNQLVTAGIANKGLTESVKNFNASVEAIIARLAELETAIAEAKPEAKIRAQAVYQRDSILPKMEKLREVVDATEASMSPDNWPFPSYAALFYSL